MNTELRYLALATALGLLHALGTGVCYLLQNGSSASTGPRDDAPPLRGVYGRIDRAFANFMQTFPFFAAAVLIGQALNRHDGMTAWGAAVYFWCRVAYVPLYAAGVPWLRSLIWAVSFAAIWFVLAGIA